MQKLKCAIALTAVSVLVVSCSSGDNKDQPFESSSADISIEAEDWAGKDPSATLDWLPIRLNSDFGDAAKLVAQDSAQWSATGLPTLTYEINFTQTGRYLMNVHGRHDSNYPSQPDENTIITFGSDNGDIEYKVNGFDDQWQWFNIDSVGQLLAIEVKTPGVHQFKIASAMTGLMLDQIRIDNLQADSTAPVTSIDDNNNGSDPTPSDKNQAPTVSITGPNALQTGEQVTLIANATDDGKPGRTIYYYWTKTIGPADVLISDILISSPQITFTTPGTYILQVSANDGALYSNASITVNVTDNINLAVATDAPTKNAAPVVESMASISVSANQSALLKGNASDDGLPHMNLYYYWSRLNGPGSVTFKDRTAAATEANFEKPGVYQLQLTVSDGELYTNREVQVTVTSEAGTTSTNTDNQRPLNGNWTLLKTGSSEELVG